MRKKTNNQSSAEQKNDKSKRFFSPEVLSSPCIQIIGNRELTLDGFKGIAEYTNNDIKIKTACGIICISGNNLNIKYLSITAVVIEGNISCIEFLDKR